MIRHIEHTTLTTGDVARQERGMVHDSTLAVVIPWLREAIASGTRQRIPGVPGGYQGLALTAQGALILTVYSPEPQVGTPLPLISMGVAARSRQSGPLWAVLSAHPGLRPGIKQPKAPWCGVVLHPTLKEFIDATSWLGDFERSIAWAWVTRNPDIRTVDD